MKRFQKFAAVSVLAALMGAGVPAMAAQGRYGDHDRGRAQYVSSSQRNDHNWNDHRNRDRRNDYRQDRERAYVPAYLPAPVYERGYYDRRGHDGRTAAIIGGSAAAGALIGAAAGHGQGAIIGAV
ncbi:MAG: hypothetical protein ACRD3Y_09030, partial [Bryobacteraceae bacterium]